MRSDTDIKRDVDAALRSRADIDERDIAVTVNDAVVTLTGFTQALLDKQRSEEAVKGVTGVAGVANDIEVRLGSGEGLTDPEITRAAVHAIGSTLPAASESIKVLVHHGHLTLEGNAASHYLKEDAERAVRGLPGVAAVTNAIRVPPAARAEEIRQRIETALRRSAQIDANGITIDTHGGEVTLQGRVRSWPEREEAEQTAWSAPGVTRVNNRITVGFA
ncbi:MAG TPA: BON domain-containing protein [Steroidobacteraceae bacterium]|nr:BON domain-containing protein [Steroidobacteraceae bacterium]